MATPGIRYEWSPRGPVDVSSVVIACSWLALWLLWPWSLPQPGPARQLTTTRMTHWLHARPAANVRSPTDFLRSPAIPTLPGDEHAMLEARPAWARVQPLLLEQALPLVLPAPAVAGGTGVPEPGGLPAAAYAIAPGPFGVTVRMDRPLLDAGMALTDLSAFAPYDQRPWQVTLHVETGADGSPLHVLVLRSSGERALDQMAVRCVYGARLRNAMACAGRVVLNHAGPTAPPTTKDVQR